MAPAMVRTRVSAPRSWRCLSMRNTSVPSAGSSHSVARPLAFGAAMVAAKLSLVAPTRLAHQTTPRCVPLFAAFVS
ncbi:60S ribosomal protein L37a, putative [Trypanosoma brucei gambiense DAL972]|uniref:60S ribosomal protein L37a, putative n=1 Tax=Trypanosoma brucei gambiense (strain MHOM/CI/86/DAL972) TaxID=679716 RepID=D0A0Z0_TRYB9|nr:60S ribosomal protein L37a, putative [Trypanosoma brucei gambiense DAL972]CBH14932.1 60S ribosomal protein L37a, putative [Trypanosoma brucei gambiense DAL972]|eukprot:XP_011777198.1 60S ribosomal protein L37a, putative [Trypanosoma brucei gambiense DAL972]